MKKSHPIDEQLLTILNSKQFFGPADWQRFYNRQIDTEITLPIKINALQEILESDCPFVARKKVKETHVLFYLPKITINQWMKIPKSFSEDQDWFRNYNFATKSVGRHSWYLMFEGVLPNLENKNWEEQKNIIPHNYEVPLLCECVPMHFLFYLKSRDKDAFSTYRINEYKYGRVADIDGSGDRVNAGYFNYDGLTIYTGSDRHRRETLSVFAFRKLS